MSVALATGGPVVTLRSAPMTPFDGAIAAARTCYSPRVIGTDEITDRQRDTIGALTFDAGHHTVYQHAHFEFGLENISRQFVWSFLHSYPFYNSEQSSQRYVKLKEPRAFVPPIAGEARSVYEAAVVRAWDRYAELSALLKDDAFAILKDLRYVRPTTPPERLKKIVSSAQGFVYAVTMTGVTGKAVGASQVDPVMAACEYLDRVRALSPVPVCAGFGIRNAAQVQRLGPHADGVIVGSAIVEALERGESAADLLKSLRGSV